MQHGCPQGRVQSALGSEPRSARKFSSCDVLEHLIDAVPLSPLQKILSFSEKRREDPCERILFLGLPPSKVTVGRLEITDG